VSQLHAVDQHPWLVALGGRRGLVDGALPPVVFVAATYGWSLVFMTRTAVQAVLYRADQPELLALAKLALGWPLTAAAIAATLAAVRWSRSDCGHAG
jgi:hypothetical protein